MPTPTLTPEDVYLQRHAALMVTNNRLRTTLALLTVIIAALGYTAASLGRSYSAYKPLVIRINDVGHAEAVTYQAEEYKVQEAEIKYFLMDFMSRYYGRVRGAAKDDVARSLYFLTPRLADQALADLKLTKSLENFLNGMGDQTEVNVDQISIEDLRQQPYKATVTYTKAYYTQLDHVLRGRDKFSAHVQFIVMDKVPHNLIPVNPLGLTITYLREDQAFTDSPAQHLSPAADLLPPMPPAAAGGLQAAPYATYSPQQYAPLAPVHHNAPIR
jgi:type IV secretion system protein VirB5